MALLSVKIKIGDREYPMRVDSDDEERIRLAGKNVNEKMRQYSSNFGIHDKQDLLAMVAFETMVDKLKMQEKQSSSQEGLDEALIELDDLLGSLPDEE